jgi:hypothetical protein
MRYSIQLFFVFLFLGYSSIHSIGKQKTILPKNMDALIELDETEVDILNRTKAVQRIHRVISVFTEQGKEYGDVKITESEFSKCKDIKAQILDLNNKSLKKLEKKEIIESNVNYDYAIASDESYKKFSLTWHSLPYKIEYQYEIEYNSLFFWPDWNPQEDDSVLLSTYTLRLHQPISYNIHPIGIDVEPLETPVKGARVLTWELKNIPPRIQEDFMPPENHLQMALLFTPTTFKLDKYIGSFESWNGISEWYLQLSQGLQNLPQEAIFEIQGLINESEAPFEKIQKIYSFLQNHTRYVAMELGLGGWKPYSADWVFKNKYGDCKDLSNFMIALLNQVNIKAYPALIRTRDHGVVYPEYPYNYFNHVITVVPMEKDTLWLDCTAEHLPAGQLPYDDEGCRVLVVKGNGAEIVRTPQSSSGENIWRSQIRGEAVLTGRLMVKGTIEAIGNFGNSWRNALIWNKGEDQKNLLITALSRKVPRFNLLDYQLENISENYDRPVIIDFEGSITNYASISGSRLFITPAVLNRLSLNNIPDEEPEDRHFPVFRNFPYTQMDSVEILLPFGYSLESAPQPQNIVASFGEYRTDYRIEDRTLKYYRYLRIDKRLIPLEQYAEHQEFMKQVVKNDQTKFVFRKS